MMRQIFRGASVAAFVALVVACGGAISQPALDARLAGYQDCEKRQPDARVACVERMPVLRSDEPRDNNCAAYVAGQQWTREWLPWCLKRLDEERVTGDCVEGRFKCEQSVKVLDEAAACLRGQGIYAASLGCFITVEKERQRGRTNLAVLDKAWALTKQQDDAKEAERSNTQAEEERKQNALGLIRRVTADCEAKWAGSADECSSSA
jgi:hypothetical protein